MAPVEVILIIVALGLALLTIALEAMLEAFFTRRAAPQRIAFRHYWLAWFLGALPLCLFGSFVAFNLSMQWSSVLPGFTVAILFSALGALVGAIHTSRRISSGTRDIR